MAYMNQEKKKVLAPQIKAVLKKYGVKGSISVRNHSTLVVTLSEVPASWVEAQHQRDIQRWERVHADTGWAGNKPERSLHWEYNPYHPINEDDPQGEGEAEFVKEMLSAMNGVGTEEENFDKSDSMTDYFHVGWYVNLSVGRWDKPVKVA